VARIGLGPDPLENQTKNVIDRVVELAPKPSPGAKEEHRADQTRHRGMRIKIGTQFAGGDALLDELHQDAAARLKHQVMYQRHDVRIARRHGMVKDRAPRRAAARAHGIQHGVEAIAHRTLIRHRRQFIIEPLKCCGEQGLASRESSVDGRLGDAGPRRDLFDRKTTESQSGQGLDGSVNDRIINAEIARSTLGSQFY